MKTTNQIVELKLDMKEIAIIQAVLGFQIDNYSNVEKSLKTDDMDEGVDFMRRLAEKILDQEEKFLTLIN